MSNEVERYKTTAQYDDVKEDVLNLLKNCTILHSRITTDVVEGHMSSDISQFFSSVKDLYSYVGVKRKSLPEIDKKLYADLDKMEEFIIDPFKMEIRTDKDFIEKIRYFSKAYLELRYLVEFLGYTQVEHEIVKFDPQVINLQIILDRYRMMS